jgi:hypothetical protein
VYLDLERDIILKRLSVDEIRRRFTVEALGPSVTDRLRSVVEELRRSQQRLEEMFQSVTADCAQIEAMDDAAFASDRKPRVEELLSKLNKGAEEYRSKYLAAFAQIKEWLRFPGHDPMEFEVAQEFLKKFKWDEFVARYEEVRTRATALRESMR